VGRPRSLYEGWDEAIAGLRIFGYLGSYDSVVAGRLRFQDGVARCEGGIRLHSEWDVKPVRHA